MVSMLAMRGPAGAAGRGGQCGTREPSSTNANRKKKEEEKAARRSVSEARPTGSCVPRPDDSPQATPAATYSTADRAGLRAYDLGSAALRFAPLR